MYGSHRIRRIPEKLALAVEFDLTSSQGFVSAELGRFPNPLYCKTLLICLICISKVLIEAPWFLIAASVEAHISLIMLEFSSCLLADSAINLVDKVPEAFIKHYEVFLGQAGTVQNLDTHNLFDVILDAGTALDMVRNVSAQEVKSAMFSMGNDKSLGPDGYTAAFFKEAWDIVGDEVVKAVGEFFINGRLLKEINHTIIALIPKVQNPTRVNDYRHISCCNVIFKCISKILANHIKESLKTLISPNQSAFVLGRSIADNILLTQELMHNYHLDRGVPRCAFKVDIQKAYDTVDWEFLKLILTCFGFHERMVAWIMECVTTTSFSLNINGSLHGYFKGKCGMRQGDPLSLYLFMIVMEVLTLILRRRVRDSDLFSYHRYCSKMELINLCFADDLFLFAYGDTHSARTIMDALDEFKLVSGLVPSLSKSTAYFGNVLNHTKLAILQILPFEEGRLPVKYLGVPLVSSRLVFRDCKELIKKVEGRINDWKNKSLSIAGRLQLVQSVIASMHVYWASVFILPSRILLEIEQLMRGFLWCQGGLSRGKAKVAWEVVCLPKDEGGLGIRRLDLFNKALMTTHIWKLLSMKESLWVKWIHKYKIRDRNFWELPCRGNMTWGWRKILQLRPLIREFFKYKIGNGNNVSLWYDHWCSISPLASIIVTRYINRDGLKTSSKVSDVFHNGTVVWPQELVARYPLLGSIVGPNSVGFIDTLEWLDNVGVVKPFSVNTVWQAVRPSKLKMQDILRSWDVSGNLATNFPLCDSIPNSHAHLFFDCVFSKHVWNRVKDWAGLSNVAPSIDLIINVIIPTAKRRTLKCIIAKLVVAAAAYFIWHGRNYRLFKRAKRSEDHVVDCILSSVRLKLFSCHFKQSQEGFDLMRRWKISKSIFSLR
ncbi:putative RNA-directed DNA polymerase, eukaryota, reverse transcriptase zinc-binding domain protein [Tanacetum coccineum]|uniref:RNA-directed DNA polymerase, eukaryota, reverse transcriptase zinc-binding domain protein n=1 Tax=Tanacetum coccineum TaxID=301880 RepID=A0ABQ5HBU3_9ASTR